MIDLILCIIAVEALTKLIRDASVFSEIRSWFMGKSVFLEELFNCGYCISVWSAGIILVAQEYFPILVLMLSIHRLANILHDIAGIIIAAKIKVRRD